MEKLTFVLLYLFLARWVGAVGIAIDRTAWTVSADSFQVGNEPQKAIDSDTSTFWHTAFNPDAPLPHEITIDMKNTYLIGALSYLPRQDGNSHGNIGQHTIELSTDGANWGSPVGIGTFLNDASLKKSTFVAQPARYVRLTAYSEAEGQGYQWTSAADINVYRVGEYTSRSGWAIQADSQETAAENDPATNAIDGVSTTFWHTEYSNALPGFPHWFKIDQGAPLTVAGLSYLPRPASSGANGRIGNYSVDTSNDGTTWTTITSGTWADDASEKFAMFTATSARYFRLNSFSEAGNRGVWSSAAEINLINGTTTFNYAPPPASKGQWLDTIDLPIVPAAAALMPSGNVLFWSSYKPDDFTGDSGTGLTQTAIWNPSTGDVTQRTISNTDHDMFCPGISVDFSGRVIVTGGNDASKTSIYDPASDSWIAGPDMQIPRGYQATATCSDGRIFNIGGSWSGGEGNKNGEIYNPTTNAWTLLPGCPVAPMLTVDNQGVYREDNHGWLFGWKSGTVFQAGPSKNMNWYGTAGSGSQTPAGTRGDDPDSINGNAIMYDAVAGKILAVGGAQNYQTNAARANAHLITLNAINTNPTVTTLAPMAYARAFGNGVVLPDGTVFVTGGQAWAEPFTDDTAALTPELWNPSTQQFTQMNPMATARTYHSVALLLLDATVMNGGGGLCGSCNTNHWDAEVFVPPYLLNSDGTRRTRPVINSISSATIKVGGVLMITTDSAVTSFSMIRLGSATHTVDTDQRRVPLTPSGSGTTYTVTVPSDPGVALPGYWMVFAMNSAGTPSVAKVVQVTLT